MFTAVLLGIGVLAPPAHAAAAACQEKLVGPQLPAEKVYSGSAAEGSVTLKCAPTSATVVSLSSADAGWVGVPASVTVPAGLKTATFTLRTHQKDYVYDGQSTDVTARLKAKAITRPLAQQPGLKLFSVKEEVEGGDLATVQILLNGPAPAGGVTVTLSTSDPAAVPSPRSAVRRSREASSSEPRRASPARSRSGFAAAMTGYPAFFGPEIVAAHPEESANAPCTLSVRGPSGARVVRPRRRPNRPPVPGLNGVGGSVARFKSRYRSSAYRREGRSSPPGAAAGRGRAWNFRAGPRS